MRKKIKRFSLILMSCFLIASVCFLVGENDVIAQTRGTRHYLRTDSLTASSETAAIIEQNGVELSEGEQGIVLNKDDMITFEFDLSEECTGGDVKIFGENLSFSNNAAPEVKVGIYIPGYGENDNYFVLTPENRGSGEYGFCVYGFGNTSWYDQSRNMIRVRIWGASDEKPVCISGISVNESKDGIWNTAETGSGTLTPFTEGDARAYYFGAGIDLVFDQENTPKLVLNDAAIWEIFVNKNITEFIPEFTVEGNAQIKIKDSGELNGGSGSVSDPAGIRNSG